MGQLTQTTAQVQVILDDADAANVGKTSLTDGSDTTSVAFKKSGFYSLQGSSANAPSTDRAVLISAVRDTAATGEIRYGQIAITESNGLWWNRDDGGSLGTWYEAVTTASAQTLTNKTLTSPILTTPQINDSAADHQYIFAGSNLTADRTVTLPLLTGDDTFVFAAHTQTLTNKTLTTPTVSGLTLSDASIIFEGATANDHETTLTVTDPTADRTITLPDATDTLVGRATTDTLTNKTLTSPIASGLTLSDASIVFEGATADAHETTLTVTDPTADRTITLPNATDTLVGLATTDTLTNKTLTSPVLNTGVSGTAVLDNDDFTGASATKLASSESIKAYVDSQVGSFDTLSEVLAAGNTTGGTDIAVGTGDDITFADNSKAIFGAGDLQIYHDGSNSYVEDAGDGALFLKTNGSGVFLYSGSEALATFNLNGASNLYYDNGLKLSTTSTGVDVTGTVTAASSSAGTLFTLQSSEAGASSGPDIVLFRNSASPADDDALSTIFYQGKNSAGSTKDYMKVRSYILDVTDGTEDFGMDIQVMTSGNAVNALDILPSELVINNAGVDRDFRVESDNNTHALFVQGSDGSVGIGVANGDVKSDGNSNRTYVGIIGSGNRGVLNIGSTAANGADGGTISFVNGTNELGALYNDATAGSQTTGTMYLTSNGVLDLRATGGVVINEYSAAADFRVESTDNANMIKLDGTNNRVGIGKSPASNPFEVAGYASFDSGASFAAKTVISAADGVCANDYVATISNLEATDGQSFGLSLNAGSNSNDIALNVTDYNGANGLFRVFGSGAVTVNGGSQAGGDFTVLSDNNSHMLFVDASTDTVGINMSAPMSGAALQVRTSTDKTIAFTDTISETGNVITLQGQNDAADALVGIGLAGSSIRLERGDVTCNDNSADVDFRVEGNNNANCFVIDGTNDYIRINATGTPSASVSGFLFTSDQLYTSAGSSTSTNTQIRFINGNGLVGSISTAGSGTAYATSSDQRLKDNIADAADAGELIDAIRVRQFDWKNDGEHQRYGMVAQELDPVVPEAVIKTDDPEDMMAVDYSKLVPMLVKEIQTLRARLADLES